MRDGPQAGRNGYRFVSIGRCVVTKRYPNGTWCGGLLPLVVLLMPYALARYAIDRMRGRRD
jgi:hypothetical protein